MSLGVPVRILLQSMFVDDVFWLEFQVSQASYIRKLKGRKDTRVFLPLCSATCVSRRCFLPAGRCHDPPLEVEQPGDYLRR